MKLNFNKVDDALNLSIEGRLDTTTAPELDSFLTENLDGVGELKQAVGKCRFAVVDVCNDAEVSDMLHYDNCVLILIK